MPDVDLAASGPGQPYVGLFLEDLAFSNAEYDTGMGTLSEPGLKCVKPLRPSGRGDGVRG